MLKYRFFAPISIFQLILLSNFLPYENIVNALLFPQFTVLQITMCMVIPIIIPNRKIALNMGVQVNYNTPYTPKEFYNPPYWQAKSFDESPKDETNNSLTAKVKRDISAGEFYTILGEALKFQGLENAEECILKAVCQMAEYPLVHGHDDLIEEVLHFIFTPSVHQAFTEEEISMRMAFEEAESIGEQQGDCNVHFPKCLHTPIDKLTRLEHNLI